jgi:hypothetical protein
MSPALQLPPVAVHPTHAPNHALALDVSQIGVAPLHAPPLSPHEHKRQLAPGVPEQIASDDGPVLIHLPFLLLHSSWTIQVRPSTVIGSPARPSSQMSAISPQLLSLSPQAAG